MLLFLCFCLIPNLFAQHSISLGPQLNVVSKFSRYYNSGVGGSLEYVHKISGSFGTRASINYDYFKSEFSRDYKAFKSLRVGLKGFLTKNAFVAGDIGIGLYKDFGNDNETGLTYAVGFGYRLPVATTQFIQLSAAYVYDRHLSLDRTWFSFRGAYGLSWGKNQRKENGD